MIGTRAHGKTRIYRSYSCYRRTRYDTTACTGSARAATTSARRSSRPSSPRSRSPG